MKKITSPGTTVIWNPTCLSFWNVTLKKFLCPGNLVTLCGRHSPGSQVRKQASFCLGRESSLKWHFEKVSMSGKKEVSVFWKKSFSWQAMGVPISHLIWDYFSRIKIFLFSKTFLNNIFLTGNGGFTEQVFLGLVIIFKKGKKNLFFSWQAIFSDRQWGFH